MWVVAALVDAAETEDVLHGAQPNVGRGAIAEQLLESEHCRRSQSCQSLGRCPLYVGELAAVNRTLEAARDGVPGAAIPVALDSVALHTPGAPTPVHADACLRVQFEVLVHVVDRNDAGHHAMPLIRDEPKRRRTIESYRRGMAGPSLKKGRDNIRGWSTSRFALWIAVFTIALALAVYRLVDTPSTAKATFAAILLSVLISLTIYFVAVRFNRSNRPG